ENRGVIGGTVLDGLIKNRRVRGQSGHQELVNVTFESAVVQQVAGDVVEPEALAHVVQQSGGVHILISRLILGPNGWCHSTAGSPAARGNFHSRACSSFPCSTRRTVRQRSQVPA